MDTDARRRDIVAAFDRAASGYDHEALRFFGFCADRLVNLLRPLPGVKLLDIAAGTGAATLAAAQAVGPQGRVAAVDLSEAMLACLEEKIRHFKLANVDIHVMDATALEFRRDYFDHAICSFGLFFMPDMVAALRGWRRVLKPGGTLAFSAFGPQAFQPQMRLFFETLARHGIAPDVQSPLTAAQRLYDPQYCRALSIDAGLSEVAVYTEQFGYHLPTAEDWWTVVWNSALRAWIERLPEAQRADFRDAHLAEIEALKTPDGLWLDIEAQLVIGRKPAS